VSLGIVMHSCYPCMVWLF